MAAEPAQKWRVNLRLIHDGVQPGPPLDEKLHFGLQDTKGEVHPGTTGPGGTRRFDLALDVKPGTAGQPVFSGAFAHGPPAGRFLYLSWKREDRRIAAGSAPWGWRIKMPLAGIGWAEIRAADKSGTCVVADVTGRRPHSTQAIEWRLETEQHA
jgi:hypothetical protein